MIEYIFDVNEEEIMLARETKTYVKKCSNISVGDLLLTKIPGDSTRVLEINVGEQYTTIVFGNEESTSMEKYENTASLMLIQKDTLN